MALESSRMESCFLTLKCDNFLLSSAMGRRLLSTLSMSWSDSHTSRSSRPFIRVFESENSENFKKGPGFSDDSGPFFQNARVMWLFSSTLGDEGFFLHQFIGSCDDSAR